METRSAKKRQMTMDGSSHSTPNGQHSSQAINGAAETEEMKQAAFVKAVQSTGALVLYLLSSSYIIILNKQLMVDDGFKFPLTLTGLSQVAGALAGAYNQTPCCSREFHHCAQRNRIAGQSPELILLPHIILHIWQALCTGHLLPVIKAEAPALLR